MHILRTLARSFLLALVIFSIHVLLSLFNYLITGESGYYGFLGGVVYAFIFAFWIYLVLSGIYIYISRNDLNRITRYYKAICIVLVGFIVSIVPSISEYQFFQKFDWNRFYIFLNVPLLVEIEFWLRGKRKENAGGRV
jgi:hypothetical protein